MADSRLEDVSSEELRDRLRRSTDGDEVKRLVAARETLAGKSPEQIEERFGWSREVVESWLGLIERDGLEAGTSPPEEPPERESRSWLRIGLALAAIGLVVLAIQGGFLSPNDLPAGGPGGLLGAGDAGASVGGTPVDGAIEIETIDVQYLNRIYGEQDTEVAYCGVFEGRRMVPKLANLTYSSERHARFTTRDCREASGGLGTIHTHPNGNPEVSPGDRSAFRESEFTYTCIQHGRITTEVGTETDALRCYERPAGRDGLRRVPVRVTAPPT
jgi:proteasome lid subunit RPN8/RPN11